MGRSNENHTLLKGPCAGQHNMNVIFNCRWLGSWFPFEVISIKALQETVKNRGRKRVWLLNTRLAAEQENVVLYIWLQISMCFVFSIKVPHYYKQSAQRSKSNPGALEKFRYWWVSPTQSERSQDGVFGFTELLAFSWRRIPTVRVNQRKFKHGSHTTLVYCYFTFMSCVVWIFIIHYGWH